MKFILYSLCMMILSAIPSAKADANSEFDQLLEFIKDNNKQLSSESRNNTKYVKSSETLISKVSDVFTKQNEITNSEEVKNLISTILNKESSKTIKDKLKGNEKELSQLFTKLNETYSTWNKLILEHKTKGVSIDYYSNLRSNLFNLLRLKIYREVLWGNQKSLKTSLLVYLKFFKTYQAESTNLIPTMLLMNYMANLIEDLKALEPNSSQKKIISSLLKKELGELLKRDEFELIKQDLINSFYTINYVFWNELKKPKELSFKTVLALNFSDEHDTDLQSYKTLVKFFEKNKPTGSFSDLLIPILFDENLPTIKMSSNVFVTDFLQQINVSEFLDGNEFNFKFYTLQNSMKELLAKEIGLTEFENKDKIYEFILNILNDTEKRTKLADTLKSSDYLYYYLFFMSYEKLNFDFSLASYKIINKRYILEKRLNKF